jgi:hypothetical protein
MSLEDPVPCGAGNLSAPGLGSIDHATLAAFYRIIALAS